jgi:apolipoprotein N-acyltransferase
MRSPEPLVLAQSAALIGIWGLTFIAVAVFASPAVLDDDRTDYAAAVAAARARRGRARRARGLRRDGGFPARRPAFVEGVRLRIMQPNLQQDRKFNYGAKQRVMSQYPGACRTLDRPAIGGVRDVTHLIWPESAFPFLLTREPDALAQIAALMPGGHRADHRRGPRALKRRPARRSSAPTIRST